MFYRCLNDVFGYCKEIPDFVLKEGETVEKLIEPTTSGAVMLQSRKCNLDRKTCSKYSTTHCSKEVDNG